MLDTFMSFGLVDRETGVVDELAARLGQMRTMVEFILNNEQKYAFDFEFNIFLIN